MVQSSSLFLAHKTAENTAPNAAQTAAEKTANNAAQAQNTAQSAAYTNAANNAAQYTAQVTAQYAADMTALNTSQFRLLQSSCSSSPSPLQLLMSCSQTRTQFINFCLRLNGINNSNSKYFISSVRPSTRNQYEHVWKVFCEFCHSHSCSGVSNDLIISFFDHLIKNKKLRAKTLLSYKCALIDPLKYGFNFDINNDIIAKSLRGIANLHPEPRCRAPDWSLDLVLQYLIENKNNKSFFFFLDLAKEEKRLMRELQ